jgi:large subunit ribosomal protein L5
MKLDFRSLYREKVVPSVMKEFNYSRLEQVPKIIKVSLNRGVGGGARGSSEFKRSMKEVSLIGGQFPIPRKARKSVAGFKIRDGMQVGVSVNLRRERMYAFIARLVHIVLPRVRDFRGLGISGFDGSGNYGFGIADQLAFPEVPYDEVVGTQGVGLSIVTTSESDTEARFLLTLMGFIFRVQNTADDV